MYDIQESEMDINNIISNQNGSAIISPRIIDDDGQLDGDNSRLRLNFRSSS